MPPPLKQNKTVATAAPTSLHSKISALLQQHRAPSGTTTVNNSFENVREIIRQLKAQKQDKAAAAASRAGSKRKGAPAASIKSKPQKRRATGVHAPVVVHVPATASNEAGHTEGGRETEEDDYKEPPPMDDASFAQLTRAQKDAYEILELWHERQSRNAIIATDVFESVVQQIIEELQEEEDQDQDEAVQQDASQTEFHAHPRVTGMSEQACLILHLFTELVMAQMFECAGDIHEEELMGKSTYDPADEMLLLRHMHAAQKCRKDVDLWHRPRLQARELERMQQRLAAAAQVAASTSTLQPDTSLLERK